MKYLASLLWALTGFGLFKSGMTTLTADEIDIWVAMTGVILSGVGISCMRQGAVGLYRTICKPPANVELQPKAEQMMRQEQAESKKSLHPSDIASVEELKIKTTAEPQVQIYKVSQKKGKMVICLRYLHLAKYATFVGTKDAWEPVLEDFMQPMNGFLNGIYDRIERKEETSESVQDKVFDLSSV